jgi:hypothetical protein
MNTTVNEIDHIKDILSQLPKSAVHEVRDFAAYLADRERRRKKLEKRVLKAEKEPPIGFESIEDAVKAVFDEAKA